MVMWTAVRAFPLIPDNAIARLEAADPLEVPSEKGSPRGGAGTHPVLSSAIAGDVRGVHRRHEASVSDPDSTRIW